MFTIDSNNSIAPQERNEEIDQKWIIIRRRRRKGDVGLGERRVKLLKN